MTDTLLPRGIPKPVTGTLSPYAVLDQFLAEMEASPDDFGLRSILADWCSENGMEDAAECLRWTVEKEKRPRDVLLGEWVWYELESVLATGIEYDPSPWSNLPAVIFRELGSWVTKSRTGESGDVGGRKAYKSFRAAEEALWAAWAKAKAEGKV
jgi:uncharacterized protein (TIGR02996 family)